MKKFCKIKLNVTLLFAIFTIILSPIFVNGLMTINCNLATSSPDIWIGFWGAYLGAVGTFTMAAIAYRQLQILNEQNRPYLFPSIEIFAYRENNMNSFDYCLRIANHGSRIASNIHIEIECLVFEEMGEKYNQELKEISHRLYSIPEKEDIILRICPELSKNSANDKDYNKWLEKFKKSDVLVKLTYNDNYYHEELIPINDVMYARTNQIQMLYYLKNSVDELNETLKANNNSPKNSILNDHKDYTR